MPCFEYEGLTPGGTAIRGQIEADDHQQAAQDLALMQIEVRQLEKTSKPQAPARLSADDLIFFNEQLASLAQAGIALDEGLAQLARDLESSNLKRWVTELVEDLRRGVPLEQAVAARQQGLPILYSQVIRAGVDSGELPATLLNLNQHLRLAGDARRLFWELTSYPLLIAVLALTIISGFFLFIVPHFADIFKDFGTRLPGITVLIIHISFVYPQILLVLAAVMLGLAALWRMLYFSTAGRAFRERFLLRMPLIGPLTRSSLVARFLRMIATAVSTGLPLPRAIRLSAQATGNSLLINDADRLATEVEHGESVFVASQSARLIPPLFGFCAQVAIGRDGLPVAMAQLARAYESRSLHALAMIRVVLFPTLIIILGVFLLFAIAGMFLPLVSLINSVSGG